MSVILLILMVAVFIAVELIRERHRRLGESWSRGVVFAGMAKCRPQPMRVPVAPHGTFIAPGHTWLRFASDGTFWLGIDEFLSEAVGRVHTVDLPKPYARVRRGDPLLALCTQRGRLVVAAPADGEVITVNDNTRHDPHDLATDPYGLGWLVSLRPTDQKEAIAPLFVGNGALAFLGREYRRLVDFITAIAPQSDAATAVLADGGLLERGVLQQLDSGELGAFEQEFLREN